MALRALQGPAGGAAPVGGTGTTNTIPRWTGASTLGDSGLIDNGTAIYTTTRNVGIGETSPASYGRLAVTGSAAGAGILGMNTDATRVDIQSYNKPLAINRAGNNTLMNEGGGNVGIGTASPGTRLHVLASAAPIATLASSQATQGYLQLNYNTSTTFGYIGNGASVIGGGAAGDLGLRSDTGVISFATGGNTERARIDSTGNLILNTANTGATIQAAGSQQGLKLPATPGNTDPNTLDSYREGTRVLAAGDLSGWTYVTATQYWTLVGRTVTLHTVFTGGTSSATGGATIATPPLLTPLRIAAGAAVNSSGTALGNGVCVVASTSSTTGTVITSNAISSSAVDKVLTVTYETAGL